MHSQSVASTAHPAVIHSQRRANHRPATGSFELILVVNGKPERRIVENTTPHDIVKACRRALQEVGRGCLLAYDMATGKLVFEA